MLRASCSLPIDEFYQVGLRGFLECLQANVRLMIDAEHSYFQPAIDHAVLELQRVFNVHRPTVFNTIQCYTKVRGQLLCLPLLHYKLKMTAR